MLRFTKFKNKELYITTNKLLILTVVAIMFILLRVFIKGTLVYTFLIWNVFLAWLPFLLSIIFTQLKFKNKVIGLITSFFWLIFFPNAPYIVTDFIHLSAYDFYGRGALPFNNSLSMWYDFFLLAIFVIIGLVLSYKSLKLVHSYYKSKYGQFWSWIIAIVVSLLSGYAIYIGRFIRVNSWEVVTNPSGIITTILGSFNLNCLILSTIFGIMVFMLFLALDSLDGSEY